MSAAQASTMFKTMYFFSETEWTINFTKESVALRERKKKKEKSIVSLKIQMWIKFNVYSCHPDNISIALAIALNSASIK